MKAVAIKGVKEFEIKNIDEPVPDGENVIVEIIRCGICGSDIHSWVDGNPKGLIMGHEFCGKVVDPGNRKDLNVGDRVTALPISPCGECDACKSGNVQYCRSTWTNAVGLSLNNPGALTEKIKIRPDMVIKVNDNITDDEVSMVEPIAVSFHAIRLSNIKFGDKVLVIGGGIIGLAAAMFAKKEGASMVVVSETNEKRGEKAISLNVSDYWVDAKDSEFPNKLINITNGGFDHIIECCGNSAAVSSALTVIKPGADIVLVGVSTSPVTIPTVLAVMGEVTLKGAIAYTKEEFEKCIDLISSKKLSVTKFIDDIVGLDDVQSSYERLTSGNDDAIKILIDPKK